MRRIRVCGNAALFLIAAGSSLAALPGCDNNGNSGGGGANPNYPQTGTILAGNNQLDMSGGGVHKSVTL